MTPSRFRLVPAEQGAMPELARWVPTRQAVHLFGGPMLPHPMAAVALLATSAEGWQVFLLLDDDQAVATGSLRRLDDGVLRMGRILVDPSRRGQGLGRVLVTALLHEARRWPGAERVSLGVYQTNAPAQHLYRSLGFVETARHTEVLADGPTAVLEMELALHP